MMIDFFLFNTITSVNNGEKIVDKLCDKGLFGLSWTWKKKDDF